MYQQQVNTNYIKTFLVCQVPFQNNLIISNVRTKGLKRKTPATPITNN